MKKIAIITMSHSTNYGGVLQSVALDHILKKHGANVSFIVHQCPTRPYKRIKDYLSARKTVCGSDGIKNKIRMTGGIIKTLINNRHYFKLKTKIARFHEFRNCLSSTSYYPNCEAIIKADLKFDCYITGSDQVWNNKFSGGEFDPCYLLEFVRNGEETYSYAASTGGRKPDLEIALLSEKIRHFNGVSVREESLRLQLLAQGIPALTVADPTLLLSREEWTSRQKGVRLPQQYILVYCLEYDEELDKCIRKVKNKTGYPVIDVLPDISKVKSVRKNQSMCFGPAEFLYAIDHAQCVITNSFHALAFSYIFQKKFGCVLRKGQEERMVDFLDLLGLKNRIICADNCEVTMEDIDYTKINIDSLIKTSNDYIRTIVSAQRCINEAQN